MGKANEAMALYFVYSDQDTSGDGEVSKSDRSKLALAKANGEGFANVLSGIDHVYSVRWWGSTRYRSSIGSGRACGMRGIRWRRWGGSLIERLFRFLELSVAANQELFGDIQMSWQ